MVERRRERGKEREKGEGGVDRCTRTFEIQSGTVGGTIDDDTIIKVSFDISLGNRVASRVVDVKASSSGGERSDKHGWTKSIRTKDCRSCSNFVKRNRATIQSA